MNILITFLLICAVVTILQTLGVRPKNHTLESFNKLKGIKRVIMATYSIMTMIGIPTILLISALLIFNGIAFLFT